MTDSPHIFRSAVLFLIFLCSCAPVLAVPDGNTHDIIPRPSSILFTTGSFSLSRPDCADRFRVSVMPGRDIAESYTLRVTPDSVLITASDSAGLFYARQTLEFLTDSASGEIPCVEIDDRPGFSWRGFMQDVSRHFFSIEYLKRQIDAMARLKLNVLHLHI